MFKNPALQTAGFQICVDHRPRETFILDLENPLAQILKNIDSKWRNDLRRAERSNIEVTRSTASTDFDRFETLFIDLLRAKGFSTRHGVDFFKRVQDDATTEKLIVHLAWSDGEVVSGHVGSFLGDTAIYLLGATNSKGREIRASYLLQWAAIEYAKMVGNRFYDLGGIDQGSNPDVYRFKKRLNGRRVVELAPYELARAGWMRPIVHVLEGTHNLLRHAMVRANI